MQTSVGRISNIFGDAQENGQTTANLGKKVLNNIKRCWLVVGKGKSRAVSGIVKGISKAVTGNFVGGC